MSTRGLKASAQSIKTKGPNAPSLQPGFLANPLKEQKQGKFEWQGDLVMGNTVQPAGATNVGGHTGESCSVAKQLPRLSVVRECDISVVYVSV